MIHRLLLPLLVAAVLGGCASPAPRDDLGDLEHFELLKQMQWMDTARGGGGFDYGPGGRAAYADVVREEIIRRHPEWTPQRVALIRAQRVEIGMSHGQVVASIGWPHEYPGLLWAFRPGTGRRYVNDPAVLAERGRANRWTYGTGPDNLHVWFREGRVWHIIDNRVTARKKPHVVLVMADDQGWGDTGYNGHPFVQTPTLDAMAADRSRRPLRRSG